MEGKKSALLLNCLIGLSLLLCARIGGAVAQGPGHRDSEPITTSPSSAPSQPSFLQPYPKVPLSFEVNRGQAESRVKFLSHGSEYTLFLTATEAVLQFNGGPANKKPAVSIRLRGVDPNQHVEGIDELPGKANYFIDNDPKNWRTNVPTYAAVKYRNVYPGVDHLVSGKTGRLEYDFLLAAGVRPDRIRICFEGVHTLAVDAQGALVALVAGAQIRLEAPLAYQEGPKGREKVAANYVLTGRREVAFKLGAFDTGRPVVIDPVLSYSTYLGGGGSDSGSAIALDASGNAYVAGSTNGSFNFPITRGAFQSSLQPSGSAGGFVTKFNLTGTVLLYSTYFSAAPTAIAVDGTGNAVLTGWSHGVQIPTTAGAYQTNCKPNPGSGSCEDSFVIKLNSTGSGLVYSTHLGGSGSDIAQAVTVDSAGNAYVTGMTNSKDFPVTKDTLQPALSGTSDAFLTKLSADGSRLLYSTYIGGPGPDSGQGVALDAAGSAYIVGAVDGSFPTTPSALSLACPDRVNEGGSIFIAKVSAAGSALIYSMASNCSNGGAGIAVDSSGSAYVTGTTHSRQLPTTARAFQPDNLRGTFRAFILKINATGTALVYGTYLGGTVNDQAASIAVDSTGRALITGATSSPDFPVTTDAFQANLAGFSVFLSAVSADGSRLAFSTYLGGTKDPGSAVAPCAVGAPCSQGNAIAVDGAGNAYITGATNSLDFQIANAFQSNRVGARNAFVGKIVLNKPTINPGGAVIAASFSNQPLSGGSIASLFGTGFASGPATAGTIPLPTSLAGVTVQVNNQQAPLFFVSPNQINFQMPWELAGSPQASITVTVNGVVGGLFTAPMAPFAPGLFSTNSTGSGQGAISISASGELAASIGSIPGSRARPAKRGEFVSIFCTGLGPVLNAPPTGAAVPANPLASTLTSPLVTIGGIPATMTFAGLAPSFVSLYQVNVQVPDNVQTGNAIPVVLSIGGVISNTVTIAVQ